MYGVDKTGRAHASDVRRRNGGLADLQHRDVELSGLGGGICGIGLEVDDDIVAELFGHIQ
jgi:hypothetical protein